MEQKAKIYYVYFARCSDNGLYIGKTTDLNNRIIKHNNGTGSKFIKQHGEAKIIYYENYNSHLEASRRELQLKKWSRIKKKNLILSKFEINN